MKKIFAIILCAAVMLTTGCSGDSPEGYNSVLEENSKPKESISRFESNDPDNHNSATTGEKNAVKQAQSYLKSNGFSRDRLIEELEYDGFTNSEAIYGADNVGADWNEQAIKSAEEHFKFSAFSYNSLIEQLEYEKFTHEQAVYGVDNCNTDWNDQAAKRAAVYIKYKAFSKADIINQLEDVGFTHEQAVYGAEQNGY